MGLTGPYVLCAADSLYIRGDCRLRGVIIVAGKVRIGTGFKGAVQVFARDAIGLEERVVLQAGSGLWVNGGTRWRSVRLGENCRVDGYVVVRGNTEQPQSPYAHYHQPSSAVVRGLVYVDGIADVRGVVEGSLYAGELCHFASEGYYADLFYNVSVWPFSWHGVSVSDKRTGRKEGGKMRTEKIVWKASSLPECVVASVILMTVFLLSVEILARLAGKVREQESVVALSAALQEGLYELDDGAHTEGNYTFIYGEIRVEASLTLYDALYTATSTDGLAGARGELYPERYHLIRKSRWILNLCRHGHYRNCWLL